MYFFYVGLFLVAFQVTCHGAPERLISVPQLPAEDFQEEEKVAKRALCTENQVDKWPQANGCPLWASQGECDPSNQWYSWMQTNCYQTCNGCKVPTTVPPPTTTPPPTPVPVVNKDACLEIHNEKRALHQDTGALEWNATLAEHAQAWADHLAAEGNGLNHDGKTKIYKEGENLFWAYRSTVASCADAVEDWYSEESVYFKATQGYTTYPPSSAYGAYGHFTQVVWKGTTQVGAALAKITLANGYIETYVVARYFPAGNLPGHYKDNVGPKNA